MKRLATVVIPEGYASAKEFADDCGFELIRRSIPMPLTHLTIALLRQGTPIPYGAEGLITWLNMWCGGTYTNWCRYAEREIHRLGLRDVL